MAPQVINFEINGVSFPPPFEWDNLQILARFDDDNVQTTLLTDDFRLVNAAAEYVKQQIENGKTGAGPGIFQGVPFKSQLNYSGQVLDFKGYLDLTTIHHNHPTDVKLVISRMDVNEIKERLQGMTFEMLKSLSGNPSPPGKISPSDYTAVQYIVEKEFVEAEFLMLSVTTFIMAKEVAERTRIISERTAELVAAIAMIPPQPSQIAKVAVLLLLDVAYAAAMVIALKKMIEEIVEFVFPPVRTHQGITFRRALERAFEFLGYSFTSPITDLDWVYVPSKPEGSTRLNEGIPNPQDYGYKCGEMLDLCRTMFNARLRVDETKKTVELRSLNDPFWKQTSTYIMPDHLDEEVDYNTDQMVQTRLVSFAVDSIDYWTVKGYKGTAFELTTIAPNPGNPEFNAIKGLDEIRIQLALGARKDNLTDIEKALLGITKTMDAVLSVFGASTGISAKIRNRTGLLRQGTRYHSIPKVILWEGGKIPADHRDRLSARYLYNTYINQKSLTANNFAEQKRVYDGRTRAMTFNSFVEAIKNKFFTTADGKSGEFKTIKWGFDLDKAECDYMVQETYTKNLQEIPAEPE